jgi:RNA polymerase sigma-70 factor, ECF subfamily
MNNNQSELLDRARAGDAAALEALLAAVQPQLYRFSLKMCRHTEDAEDILQESMVTLARSFRDFRGESSLSTWLFTITRSLCIKKRRKSKFAPKREESLEELTGQDQQGLQASSPNPHSVAESAQLWRQVQVGIQQIDPPHREVLLLRDIEGLTAKEVAEVVGISVSAVKSRLHRARAELRNNLSRQAYTPPKGCPDIRAVFSQHLEGELSPDTCSQMEAHLASCPHCATECDELRSALNACSTAPPDIPFEVRGRVQRAIAEAIRQVPEYDGKFLEPFATDIGSFHMNAKKYGR